MDGYEWFAGAVAQIWVYNRVPQSNFLSNPLSGDAVQLELNGIAPRGHVIAQAPELPFGFQSPRQFELLAYALLEAEAREQGWYDVVQILPEGADEGADVLLFSAGDLAGIVQCKRYGSKIGSELVLVELFRFLLFASLDGRVLRDGCQYQFWTANNITKEATSLFSKPQEYLRSLPQAELAKLIEKAKSTAKTLKAITLKSSDHERFREQACRMDLRHVGPIDLSLRLSKEVGVRKLFFRSPEDVVHEADAPHIERQMSARRREQLAEASRAGRTGAAPFVPPAALGEAFSDFVVGVADVFVLTGGSGRGKSTWTARLQESPPSAFEVDVIAGHEIAAGDNSLVTTLARILSRRSDSLGTVEGEQRALWTWLDLTNRLIIIDGLDRAPASARSSLSYWLAESIRVCANRAVRLALTSRPETWSHIGNLLDREVLRAVFHIQSPSPLDGGDTAPSYQLPLLSSMEAKGLYGAYRLPQQLHGRRALNTPALIARYSELREELGDFEVTRRDIIQQLVKTACGEVASHGFGRATTDQFLGCYGSLVQKSADGRVALRALSAACPDASQVIDAFLHTDLFVLADGNLRAEPDEATEYLGSLELDIEGALTALPTRGNEPLFVGMLALAVAALEQGAPQRVGEIVDNLLGKGKSRVEREAGIRIVVELRNHDRFEPLIRLMLRTMTEPAAMLFGSNLGDLIHDIRLPLQQRLDLLLELETNEDPDDWRSKFWTDPWATGRFITPFARAAVAAVRAEPTASIPWLVDRYKIAPARAEVASGLILEAGAIDPENALKATWPLRNGPTGTVFRDLAYLHPHAAARQIIAGCEGKSRLPIDVPERLWELVRDHRPEVFDGVTASKAIADAASFVLPKSPNRICRAILMLTIARGGPLNVAAQDQLAGHWEDVGAFEVWPLIAACPVHKEQLLDKVFAEADGDGLHSSALRYLGAEVPWEPLLRRLLEASRVASSKVLRNVALAVEDLLYRSEEGDQSDDRLHGIARVFATSSDEDVRSPILYFAGSPIRFAKAKPGHVSFRDQLLEILIENEDGATLPILVWKLCESASERGQAAERLLDLCKRFGTDQVEKDLDFYLLQSETGPRIFNELQLLLRQHGLPGLTVVFKM